jgi:uncharacterized Zn finger protein
MPNVLIKCPETGETVPTMLRMKPQELEALNAPRAFRCTKCGHIHSWTKAEAWLEPA